MTAWLNQNACHQVTLSLHHLQHTTYNRQCFLDRHKGDTDCELADPPTYNLYYPFFLDACGEKADCGPLD